MCIGITRLDYWRQIDWHTNWSVVKLTSYLCKSVVKETEKYKSNGFGGCTLKQIYTGALRGPDIEEYFVKQTPSFCDSLLLLLFSSCMIYFDLLQIIHFRIRASYQEKGEKIKRYNLITWPYVLSAFTCFLPGVFGQKIGTSSMFTFFVGGQKHEFTWLNDVLFGWLALITKTSYSNILKS